MQLHVRKEKGAVLINWLKIAFPANVRSRTAVNKIFGGFNLDTVVFYDPYNESAE